GRSLRILREHADPPRDEVAGTLVGAGTLLSLAISAFAERAYGRAILLSTHRLECARSSTNSFGRACGAEDQFESPGGATVNPRGPARSIACCTRPEAFACSTNSLI